MRKLYPPRCEVTKAIRLIEDSNRIRQKTPGLRFGMRNRYNLIQHSSDKIIITEEKCLDLKQNKKLEMSAICNLKQTNKQTLWEMEYREYFKCCLLEGNSCC